MTLPLQLVILGWVAQCLFFAWIGEDNTRIPRCLTTSDNYVWFTFPFASIIVTDY